VTNRTVLKPLVIIPNLRASKYARSIHPEWWIPYFEPIVFALHDTTIVEEHTNRSLERPFAAGSVKRQQFQDYLTIFRYLASVNCYGYSFFMVSEDDTAPCASSEVYFDFVYKFAEGHPDNWSLIRVGLGYNGLIMKCSLLRNFISDLQPLLSISLGGLSVMNISFPRVKKASPDSLMNKIEILKSFQQIFLREWK